MTILYHSLLRDWWRLANRVLRIQLSFWLNSYLRDHYRLSMQILVNILRNLNEHYNISITLVFCSIVFVKYVDSNLPQWYKHHHIPCDDPTRIGWISIIKWHYSLSYSIHYYTSFLTALTIHSTIPYFSFIILVLIKSTG